VTSGQAAAFAAVALANVVREYPRHVHHVLNGPGEDSSERKRHPAFYGSYDWHSAVHMHWLLARVQRLFPRPEISRLLDRHLSADALQTELDYFNSAAGRTFERPYGWAWLLRLQAELLRIQSPNWSAAVRPLAEELAGRMARFVSGAPYPIRAGAHGNTAFACLLALDYCRVANDRKLKKAIQSAARRWYGKDRKAPLAYEPSLDDFLSPALIEAALMQEVLPAARFRAWMKRFVTGIEKLKPPRVADRSDPKQSHLDGLALSRAWCLRKLGYAKAAERHLAAALPHVVGGHYVGEHWLASFACLALTEEARKRP
jgi:hypothetical protein